MKKYILALLLFTQLSAQDKLPWLSSCDGKIINELGKTTILRGVNLGGWLTEEMWMLSFKTDPPKKSRFSEITDRASLWKVFNSRFGAKHTEKIRTAFRQAWLTEGDFARIRSAGFNCVRLPFTYDLMDEPGGLFRWLDWAIDTANKYELYVILDMHGAPGRQSSKHHTGEEKIDRLFFDPLMVKKSAEIWAQIAFRYKDRSVIAGYDLLNEPSGAPDVATLYLVQDQLYRAIRVHDTKHTLIIEDGFKGVDRMPNPVIVGWHNVIYSTHTYAHDTKSKEEFLQDTLRLINLLGTQQNLFQCHMYLGEFNVEPYTSIDLLKELILALQVKSISWSFWTYKIAGNIGRGSLWGLYNPEKRVKKIDPFEESLKDILKKIQQLRTENFDENTELKNLFLGTL